MEGGVNKRIFKKGINAEDSRRRREANSIQIRKEKKEENLAKRRNIHSLVLDDEQPAAGAGLGTQSSTVDRSAAEQSVSVNDISALMAGLQSSDLALQISSLRSFRRLLSVEKNPPVQTCIDCGAVPLFVMCLQRFDCMELQFEAAWALTNIASTDRTRLVVECGAVPHLVALLTSANPDIREQSAWCLGNVAGDSTELRSVVLAAGALHPLLANIMQPATISLLRNCTWTLSNFCRGKPQPDLAVLAPALPVLVGILTNNIDEDTIVDAVWALSYISDGSNDRIQVIVDTGVLPFLTVMLQSPKSTMVVPALRTLGNVVSGTDTQTQAVLQCNVLPVLVSLLANSKKNIRKEACWMLSNIAAGSAEQLVQLIAAPNLLTRVLAQMSAATEWDVRKEAVWVISNIIATCNRQHIVQLVEMGVIRQLCDLLDVHEARVLIIALDALDIVLQANPSNSQPGSSSLNYTQLVDEAGGLDKLEGLQEHVNSDVYNKAVAIIERYFGLDEEGQAESENLAPKIEAGSNTFAFGLTPAMTNGADVFKSFGSASQEPINVFNASRQAFVPSSTNMFQQPHQQHQQQSHSFVF